MSNHGIYSLGTIPTILEKPLDAFFDEDGNPKEMVHAEVNLKELANERGQDFIPKMLGDVYKDGNELADAMINGKYARHVLAAFYWDAFEKANEAIQDEGQDPWSENRVVVMTQGEITIVDPNDRGCAIKDHVLSRMHIVLPANLEERNVDEDCIAFLSGEAITSKWIPAMEAILQDIEAGKSLITRQEYDDGNIEEGEIPVDSIEDLEQFAKITLNFVKEHDDSFIHIMEG